MLTIKTIIYIIVRRGGVVASRTLDPMFVSSIPGQSGTCACVRKNTSPLIARVFSDKMLKTVKNKPCSSLIRDIYVLLYVISKPN